MATRKVKTFDQAQHALTRVSEHSHERMNGMIPDHHKKTLQGVMFLMRPEFQATVREIKEKSAETLEAAKGKIIDAGKEVGKRVDREAHKKPWIFVAVAAAISTILGIFLGRKTKR